MSTLKDFWKKIDAMAEEQRLKIPVWCVWETDHPDAGYSLYRCLTREEAIEKYKNEAKDGYWGPQTLVSCRPATQKQIDEHRRSEEGYGSPPGPVNPRARMEKV